MLLLELGSASVWREEDVDVDADDEDEDGLEWPFRSRTGVPDVLYVSVCVVDGLPDIPCCLTRGLYTVLDAAGRLLEV